MKLLRHFNNFGWIFAMGLYASKKMVAWSIFTTQENCLKLLHFFFINKHIHVFHWYEIYQTSLWTGHIHYAFCYYIPIYVLTVTPPPSPNTNYPPITWPPIGLHCKLWITAFLSFEAPWNDGGKQNDIELGDLINSSTFNLFCSFCTPPEFYCVTIAKCKDL